MAEQIVDEGRRPLRERAAESLGLPASASKADLAAAVAAAGGEQAARPESTPEPAKKGVFRRR
ncbi:hypothetical protein [Marinactinospora rubrisoli]|uniref:SAP domain-containing protein n=1 Tax=Marinactinospora rubrisoli TaxID=2715399 RepID=A0ABW2KLN4_9ACTN